MPPTASSLTFPPLRPLRVVKLKGAALSERQEDPARVALRGRDDYPMTHHEFGRAVETRFVHDAQRRGFVVSRPFDATSSYDAVVDNGRRLFRVQIKGTNRIQGKRAGRGAHPVYRVTLWSSHRRGTEEFDVCAVYLAGEDRWVFLDAAIGAMQDFHITVGGKHTRVGWEIFRGQETSRGQVTVDRGSAQTKHR